MEAKSSMQVIILGIKKHAMEVKACYAQNNECTRRAAIRCGNQLLHVEK